MKLIKKCSMKDETEYQERMIGYYDMKDAVKRVNKQLSRYSRHIIDNTLIINANIHELWIETDTGIKEYIVK